jgi:hypothetical protein
MKKQCSAGLLIFRFDRELFNEKSNQEKYMAFMPQFNDNIMLLPPSWGTNLRSSFSEVFTTSLYYELCALFNPLIPCNIFKVTLLYFSLKHTPFLADLL